MTPGDENASEPGLTDKTMAEVGYGKPPVQSQFRSGQSGNPKGRPRKVQQFDLPLERALAKPIKIKTASGKTEVLTQQEALMIRLISSVLMGNMQAYKLLLQHFPYLLTADVRPKIATAARG